MVLSLLSTVAARANAILAPSGPPVPSSVTGTVMYTFTPNYATGDSGWPTNVYGLTIATDLTGSRVLVVWYNHIARSTNGGNTWTTASNTFNYIYYAYMNPSGGNWLICGHDTNNTSNLRRSTNDGSSWSVIRSNATSSTINWYGAAHVSDDGTNIFVSCTGSHGGAGSDVSLNGGSSWSAFSTFKINSIATPSANVALLLSVNGYMYKYASGAATGLTLFASVTTGYYARVLAVSSTVIVAYSGVTSGSNYFRVSTDTGSSWGATFAPPAGAGVFRGVDADSAGNVWAADTAAIYRLTPASGSNYAGGTWSSVPCAQLANAYAARFSRDGTTAYALVTVPPTTNSRVIKIAITW